MKFYLGLHHPSNGYRISVPYMVSVNRILNRKKPLTGDWILDSGAFTQIKHYGKYKISEEEYLDCIGRLDPPMAFCQDWPCETEMLKKSQKNIKTHQELTLKSYLSMKRKDKRIMPVLQGWTVNDYFGHIDEYVSHNVIKTDLFGLGSLCCRNWTEAPYWIISLIKKEYPWIKLHGFGLKISAFNYPSIIRGLDSADSMAWSYAGRLIGKQNSLEFAMKWRDMVLSKIEKYQDKPEQIILC